MLVLPRANGWGFWSDFLGDFFGEAGSLRQINLEKEATVENAAGTTLDRIAPTNDLPLSSESLPKGSNKTWSIQYYDNKNDFWEHINKEVT